MYVVFKREGDTKTGVKGQIWGGKLLFKLKDSDSSHVVTQNAIRSGKKLFFLPGIPCITQWYTLVAEEAGCVLRPMELV